MIPTAPPTHPPTTECAAVRVRLTEPIADCQNMLAIILAMNGLPRDSKTSVSAMHQGGKVKSMKTCSTNNFCDCVCTFNNGDPFSKTPDDRDCPTDAEWNTYLSGVGTIDGNCANGKPIDGEFDDAEDQYRWCRSIAGWSAIWKGLAGAGKGIPGFEFKTTGDLNSEWEFWPTCTNPNASAPPPPQPVQNASPPPQPVQTTGSGILERIEAKLDKVLSKLDGEETTHEH